MYVDFEQAIHWSVKKVFHYSFIIGCCFHLTQSWRRKIQHVDLSGEYKNREPITGNWLRYLVALPYLPPDDDGDAFMEDCMSDKPEERRVNEFTNYSVNTYIQIGQNAVAMMMRSTDIGGAYTMI